MNWFSGYVIQAQLAFGAVEEATGQSKSSAFIEPCGSHNIEI